MILSPTYLAVKMHSTRFAIITIILVFRLEVWNFQTINVEGGRTKFATDESATFGTNKAPAGIDMGVFLILGRHIMSVAYNLAGCYLNRTFN